MWFIIFEKRYQCQYNITTEDTFFITTRLLFNSTRNYSLENKIEVILLNLFLF